MFIPFVGEEVTAEVLYRLMFGIIEVAEGYEPLPVLIAVTVAGIGVIRGLVDLRGISPGNSERAVSLRVNRPVSEDEREKSLEIEVLRRIVEEYKSRAIVQTILDERLKRSSAEFLTILIQRIHDHPAGFSKQRFSGTAIADADL